MTDQNGISHHHINGIGIPHLTMLYKGKLFLAESPANLIYFLYFLLSHRTSPDLKAIQVCVCVFVCGEKALTVCITGSFLCVNQTRQTCQSPTHYIHPQGSSENSPHSHSHPSWSPLPLLSFYVCIEKCDFLIFVSLCLPLRTRTP